MKIDFKLRAKNPYFWFGLIGVIFTAMNVEPSMFTSWEILINKVIELLSNPFMICSVVVAVVGVLCDPTTKGLSDVKEK